MTEDQKQRLKKLGKFLIIKLPLILGVLFLMIIGTLKLVERYPDPLRQGFEDYLSRTYNTNATIGKLEHIEFFPLVNVHATNITMHQKSNAAVVQMDVESFKISAPFWSLFMNSGRLYGLEIKNLKSSEGFLLPKAMHLEKLTIENRDGPEQYGAFLIGSGAYNGQKSDLEADVEKKQTGYKIPSNIPYSLQIATVNLNGQIDRKGSRTQTLNTVLSMGSKTSTAQDYEVYKDGEFVSDNPLYCVLNADNLKTCDSYIQE